MVGRKNQNRRSQAEVIMDILICCKKTIGTSRLMCASNTKWETVQKYIKVLTNNGLIIESEILTRVTKTKRKQYIITTKGINFLRNTSTIKQCLKELIEPQ